MATHTSTRYKEGMASWGGKAGGSRLSRLVTDIHSAPEQRKGQGPVKKTREEAERHRPVINIEEEEEEEEEIDDISEDEEEL